MKVSSLVTTTSLYPVKILFCINFNFLGFRFEKLLISVNQILCKCRQHFQFNLPLTTICYRFNQLLYDSSCVIPSKNLFEASCTKLFMSSHTSQLGKENKEKESLTSQVEDCVAREVGEVTLFAMFFVNVSSCFSACSSLVSPSELWWNTFQFVFVVERVSCVMMLFISALLGSSWVAKDSSGVNLVVNWDLAWPIRLRISHSIQSREI